MEILPNRKSTRLKDYDYSSNGIYFLTICVSGMKRVLSTIVGGDDPGAPLNILSDYGEIADRNIRFMNEKYTGIEVIRYVIMPNHIHLLIGVYDSAKDEIEKAGYDGKRNSVSPGSLRSSAPTNKVSNFVAAFKKFTAKEIGTNIWQRGFHDHIIRDDSDFQTRWQYIEENPRKWLIGKDEYYS